MKKKLEKSVRATNAIKDATFMHQENSLAVLKNILIVITIAFCVWAACSLLNFTVDFIAHHTYLSIEINDIENPYASKMGIMLILLSLLLVGAGIRAILLHLPSWNDSIGDGIANALEHFHLSYKDKNETSEKKIERYKFPTFRAAFRRFIMTLITIGTGGSGGLEGPSVALGETISSGCSKRYKVFNTYDLRIFQVAGIAAALGTLFTAPLTASLFAAEVVFGDKLIYRSFFYSLIAAVIAYYMNSHFLDYRTIFQEFHLTSQPYTFMEYVESAFVAICIASPIAFFVNIIFRWLQSTLSKLPTIPREFFGAMGIFFVCALLLFTMDIKPAYLLGTGEFTLKELLLSSGSSGFASLSLILALLIGKTLATGFTLASGGSAGLVIPSMLIGGLAGAAVFHIAVILDLPIYSESYHMFVVIGIATALVTIIEVPLAAIALIVESFNPNFGPPVIVACVLAHLLADKLQFYSYYEKLLDKVKRREARNLTASD